MNCCLTVCPEVSLNLSVFRLTYAHIVNTTLVAPFLQLLNLTNITKLTAIFDSWHYTTFLVFRI